eukprot:CAMPEP_0174348784 /NCGR_PEP_ID=MMETSP0811_2-20130205/5356_1 /TAXON_ID=73025 ORGANISM="Eutreptiella gymnastica-like, Strain CCMP1594" /NCGR_SAMPLE_ID=MMETSP0811_2 /ASSEMBLY_ACC=CAM_ASM_000667 /LENGTH=48 /DNA_ID= /DNA_START= /DNA_END= /DNA_ORIENTATION=
MFRGRMERRPSRFGVRIAAVPHTDPADDSGASRSESGPPPLGLGALGL